MSWRHAIVGWMLLVGSAQTAPAVDWPEWRGPKRDGISTEKGLLAQWPAEGPKLVWRVDDLGDGYSTPAVVGDRIYVMGNKGTEDEFVEVRSTKDGKQAWSVRVGPVGPNKGPQYPGARSTPTVDGTQLYALGSDGDLVCLDAASGATKWHKNLRTDFEGKMGQWAYSESVLIDGDTLVCTPGGTEATILALDKKTGDVIWKSAIAEGDQAAYSSAITITVGGVKQYVQFLQHALVGVDAKTGNPLWRYEHTAKGSPANIPTPIAQGTYVYSAAGRSGGGLVNVKPTDSGFEAEEVYYSAKLPTSIGGAVLVDRKLFGTNGQGLLCADFATGDVKWQDRSVGAGSTCYADGRLYVHGEKGDVALVEATDEAYKEKGRFTLPDQPDRGKSAAWAYPVVANGRLYIRDLAVMWCYDVQSSASGN